MLSAFAAAFSSSPLRAQQYSPLEAWATTVKQHDGVLCFPCLTGKFPTASIGGFSMADKSELRGVEAAGRSVALLLAALLSYGTIALRFWGLRRRGKQSGKTSSIPFSTPAAYRVLRSSAQCDRAPLHTSTSTSYSTIAHSTRRYPGATASTVAQFAGCDTPDALDRG